MRILIVGGTQFVGRHIVEALLLNGDEVTLFNRGRTNRDLFPEVEHLIGDRNSDLAALSKGEWDATIDTSAYFPRQVKLLAEALGSRGGRYVHISSVSAYETPLTPNINEDAPLSTLDDPTTEVVNGSTYGGLKALCEIASHDTFGSLETSVSIVRPTYVAGPHDHTARFTWWVERIAAGGKVVAPQPKESPFQVIDARDLADFIVKLAHGEITGTFHTVSPKNSITFGDFLASVVKEVGPQGTELVWIDSEILDKLEVTGTELPLWAGSIGGNYTSAVDPSRALSAGLAPRPLSQTIIETHESEKTSPTLTSSNVGLSSQREEEILKLAGS